VIETELQQPAVVCCVVGYVQFYQLTDQEGELCGSVYLDLALGIMMDRQRCTMAAGDGHEAVMRLLLEKEVDFEARNKDGKTALHNAAEKWHGAVPRGGGGGRGGGT
jgi:Ankyrin repeats (many copies)